MVAPGEIAFGYVYFDADVPAGSTFEFSVSSDSVDDYFLPVTITEINNTGEQILGAVVNETGVIVEGPISANVIVSGLTGASSPPSVRMRNRTSLPSTAPGRSRLTCTALIALQGSLDPPATTSEVHADGMSWRQSLSPGRVRRRHDLIRRR